MWVLYALLAALFAALVAIFGKVGVRDVDPTLATAVRAVTMAVFLALDRLSVVLVFVLAVLFLGDPFSWTAAAGAVFVVAGAILLT